MPSRTWIKIYCDGWLDGTVRKESPMLRAAWVDLLVLAGSGRFGDVGQIKLTEDVGLTDGQLAAIMGLALPDWYGIKQTLISSNRISTNGNGIINIINWRKYQSEYERQKGYRQKLQPEVTPKSTVEKEKEKEKENIGEQPGSNTTMLSSKDIQGSPVKKDKATPFVLPDSIKQEVWDAFLEMRKKKKAANTTHALNLIIKDLDKLKATGNDPNEVLDESTKRSWKGVFPVNKEGNYGKVGNHTDGRQLPQRYTDPASL